MVLSCAVTSERVFGRLQAIVSICCMWIAMMETLYYFSTHGCRRSGCCFVFGAFDELAWAAACCRALRLKKSAIVCDCFVVGMLRG